MSGPLRSSTASCFSRLQPAGCPKTEILDPKFLSVSPWANFSNRKIPVRRCQVKDPTAKRQATPNGPKRTIANQRYQQALWNYDSVGVALLYSIDKKRNELLIHEPSIWEEFGWPWVLTPNLEPPSPFSVRWFVMVQKAHKYYTVHTNDFSAPLTLPDIRIPLLFSF